MTMVIRIWGEKAFARCMTLKKLTGHRVVVKGGSPKRAVAGKGVLFFSHAPEQPS
jgi:hypothetical protein